MRLLLDTHVLLWWLKDPNRIEEPALKAIRNPRNTVYYSSVSIWEMVIKSSLGKLPSVRRKEITDALQADHFMPLPVSPDHAWAVLNLPHHHRDPFDRMLVAQAGEESLTLVTRDSKLAHYSIRQMPG